MVDRYEDELHVTEVEPVVDYVRSTSSKLADEEIAELRSRLGAEIDRYGKFIIDKTNGILIARK